MNKVRYIGRSSDIGARTFIHELVLATYWFTKEWLNLESSNHESLSDKPLANNDMDVG